MLNSFMAKLNVSWQNCENKNVMLHCDVPVIIVFPKKAIPQAHPVCIEMELLVY